MTEKPISPKTSVFPGLLAAFGLAVFALWIIRFIPLLGSASLALIIGLILGNLVSANNLLLPGMRFSEKRILETSIVLLGFELNARIFTKMGAEVWVLVGFSVVLVMVAAVAIGNYFGLSRRFSILLGAGSAICGTTAVGAIAPLVHSKEEETGLSIGIINLLGTIGLFLFPIISVMLQLTNEEAAILLGNVLQSMGHVVGGAFTLGEEVGTLATVIKMGRIVLLIPLMILLFFAVNKGKTKTFKGFPLFIPLFILSIAISQFSFFPDSISQTLAQTGNFLLLVAMVGIGFNIRVKQLAKIAGPGLLAGLSVFLLQIIVVMLFVWWR